MNFLYFHRKNNQTGTLIALSIVIFFLTLAALSSIGWVPDYVDGVHADPLAPQKPLSESVALSSLPQLGVSTKPYMPPTAGPAVEPTRIIISAIGMDLPVSNPSGAAVSALDEALLSGPVRYPISAKLNEDGNLLIFAHSSHLPVVKNQMFKAFNRISELSAGETIRLEGGGKAYIYRVSSVRRADASEEMINLSASQGRKLTLSTCDTFTGKSSRFVVEADFLASYQD